MNPPTQRATVVVVVGMRFALGGYDFELSPGDLARAPVDIKQAVKNGASMQAWAVSGTDVERPAGAIVRGIRISVWPLWRTPVQC